METTTETVVAEQPAGDTTEATEDTQEVTVLVEFTISSTEDGKAAPRERIEQALLEQIRTYIDYFEVNHPDQESDPVEYSVTGAEISETDLDA